MYVHIYRYMSVRIRGDNPSPSILSSEGVTTLEEEAHPRFPGNERSSRMSNSILVVSLRYAFKAETLEEEALRAHNSLRLKQTLLILKIVK